MIISDPDAAGLGTAPLCGLTLSPKSLSPFLLTSFEKNLDPTYAFSLDPPLSRDKTGTFLPSKDHHVFHGCWQEDTQCAHTKAAWFSSFYQPTRGTYCIRALSNLTVITSLLLGLVQNVAEKCKVYGEFRDLLIHFSKDTQKIPRLGQTG